MQISQLTNIPQAPANADVLAIEVNGVTYKVSKQTLASAIAANISPANIGAVAKTGDTMTGIYKLKHAGVDVSEADNGVSSTVWFSPVQLVDKDEDMFGLFGSVIFANGNVQSRISATNGGQSETFSVGVHKDGSAYYNITTPAALRAAAGVPATGDVPAYSQFTGNIDNLATTGMYYLSGATGTGGMQVQNKLWGMLLVVASSGGERIVQLHIDIWNDVAEFRRNNGSWQAWKRFTLT